MDQKPQSGALVTVTTFCTPVTPFTEEDSYGRNSVPQTSYVGVLTPVPRSAACVWNKAFQEVMGGFLGLSGQICLPVRETRSSIPGAGRTHAPLDHEATCAYNSWAHGP